MTETLSLLDDLKEITESALKHSGKSTTPEANSENKTVSDDIDGLKSSNSLGALGPNPEGNSMTYFEEGKDFYPLKFPRSSGKKVILLILLK